MDIIHKKSDEIDECGEKLNLPKISFMLQQSMVDSIFEIIYSAENVEPNSPLLTEKALIHINTALFMLD